MRMPGENRGRRKGCEFTPEHIAKLVASRALKKQERLSRIDSTPDAEVVPGLQRQHVPAFLELLLPLRNRWTTGQELLAVWKCRPGDPYPERDEFGRYVRRRK